MAPLVGESAPESAEEDGRTTLERPSSFGLALRVIPHSGELISLVRITQ